MLTRTPQRFEVLVWCGVALLGQCLPSETGILASWTSEFSMAAGFCKKMLRRPAWHGASSRQLAAGTTYVIARS
ncbi:hypothetical protein C8T65DRAFT_226071 [Cerioporus squamosus]|nr:hypothetical protein C8T65DRAFT_226071 [Cerioporus squamosus]